MSTKNAHLSQVELFDQKSGEGKMQFLERLNTRLTEIQSTYADAPYPISVPYFDPGARTLTFAINFFVPAFNKKTVRKKKSA